MKKFILTSSFILALSPNAFALECIMYKLKPNESITGSILSIEEMIITKKATKENEGKFEFLQPSNPDAESKEVFFNCPEKVYWKNPFHPFGGLYYLSSASEDDVPLCEYFSISAMESTPTRLACLKGEIDPNKYSKSVNNSFESVKESTPDAISQEKSSSSVSKQ
jgi:hypothetical protein